MKTFRSKIGLEILLPVCLIFGITTYTMLFAGRISWLGLLINLLALAFLSYTFLNTTYTIEDGQLRVRCGIIRYPAIPISQISRIKKTNNPLSAPAASLDRLEIRAGKKTILISPKDKHGFVAALKAENPEIEVHI